MIWVVAIFAGLFLAALFALVKKDQELMDAMTDADHFEDTAQQLNAELRRVRTERNALRTENECLRAENAEFRAVSDALTPKAPKKITARRRKRSVE